VGVVNLCRNTSASINPLMPKDPYIGRTAPLTSKRCILYIYSTNTGNKYFRHGIYCPIFFSSKCSLFHKSNVFGSCFIHKLYTVCVKIKKKNPGAKRLMSVWRQAFKSEAFGYTLASCENLSIPRSKCSATLSHYSLQCRENE